MVEQRKKRAATTDIQTSSTENPGHVISDVKEALTT